MYWIEDDWSAIGGSHICTYLHIFAHLCTGFATSSSLHSNSWQCHSGPDGHQPYLWFSRISSRIELSLNLLWLLCVYLCWSGWWEVFTPSRLLEWIPLNSMFMRRLHLIAVVLQVDTPWLRRAMIFITQAKPLHVWHHLALTVFDEYKVKFNHKSFNEHFDSPCWHLKRIIVCPFGVQEPRILSKPTNFLRVRLLKERVTQLHHFSSLVHNAYSPSERHVCSHASIQITWSKNQIL